MNSDPEFYSNEIPVVPMAESDGLVELGDVSTDTRGFFWGGFFDYGGYWG